MALAIKYIGLSICFLKKWTSLVMAYNAPPQKLWKTEKSVRYKRMITVYHFSF